MIKTGNSFIDFLSQVLLFSPLLPASVILIRKAFYSQELNLLLTLCLINFASGFCMTLFQGIPGAMASASHLFSLIETVLIFYILRPAFTLPQQSVIQIVAIAFLSAAVTYLILEKPGQRDEGLEYVEQVLLILLSGYCLLQLVRRDDLEIFHSPLFWLAAGSFFYFFIEVLLESIQRLSFSANRGPSQQGLILLDIAGIIRYLFYLVAASLPGPVKLNGNE